jgi:outer membrane protein
MLSSYRALASAAAAALLAAAGTARAETLLDAIELAYSTNPTLQAQRAAQRALDEEYVQAQAALRPTINASVSDTYTKLSENNDTFLPGPFKLQTETAGVNLTQPIYTGGAATAAIRAAERDVLQGRETLRATEAQIMGMVIQAYMDVMRDAESVRIEQENLAVLQRQLQETSAEFDVGEVTRTDVAQAEARLAAAQASLSAAQAQLQVSRANYAQVVGQTPGDLAAPPSLTGVPATFDAALDIAEKENPSLLGAQYGELAARSRVAEARAAYRPTLSAQVSYQVQRQPLGTQFVNTGSGLEPFTENPYQHTFTAGATLSVPLFTGGARGSKVRQALAQDNQAVYGVEGQRRLVLQSISQDWAQISSSHAQTLSNEEQVKAAAVAAEGERQEAQVGLRTIIDVLNAEQELRTSQLSLVQSRHDEYVFTAQLLATMGRLEIRYLNPAAPAYNPKRNFDQVRMKGWTPIDPIVNAFDAAGAPSGGGGGKATTAPIDSDLNQRGVARPAPLHP